MLFCLTCSRWWLRGRSKREKALTTRSGSSAAAGAATTQHSQKAGSWNSSTDESQKSSVPARAVIQTIFNQPNQL